MWEVAFLPLFLQFRPSARAQQSAASRKHPSMPSFAEAFSPGSWSVATYGNLLTCAAAVASRPVDELRQGPCRRRFLVSADDQHEDELGPGSGTPQPRALGRGTYGWRNHRLHRVASLTPDVHGLCVPPMPSTTTWSSSRRIRACLPRWPARGGGGARLARPCGLRDLRRRLRRRPLRGLANPL